MSFTDAIYQEIRKELSGLLERHQKLLGITVIYNWKQELDPRLLPKGLVLLQKGEQVNLKNFLQIQQNMANYRDSFIAGFLELAAETGRRPETFDQQSEGTQGQTDTTG